ncbi:hypothetical protein PRIPAC_82824 [Pristionchus pacificus]|uniref:G protein-coupled receptor n=1 Tax=Pristionchus pacificus TaxID=54126 RepID=A0A2A6CJQ7_PRIPA|nr:hypothetical protein PRIPAC_82824 [Pristionchus pacificus]|eukprot:PDM78251.1 G protein-coupled receptor [Pristionchus pacificus]
MNESFAAAANATGEYSDDECYYEPPPLTAARFWLVTVFGSIISLVSVVENLMLFFLFASRRAHRNSHNMYLLLLAFFDFFVSLAYILLMSVNVLSDYLQNPRLVAMWFTYMVPMITISHIAMSSASFLIIAASIERYFLTIQSPTLRYVQNHRPQMAMAAILLGVISKGSICFEFDISHHPKCVGEMTEWQMQYREFVFNTPYHTIWRFWYRNFVTIFAPFFILTFLNIRIVVTLQSTTANGGVFAHLAGNLALEQSRRKASARAATRTMVAVTCCYLISNIVNVILTIWEHVDKQTLFNDYLNFYAIAVDMVSLLTTLACACRLPIYLYCQTALRTEILNIFRAWYKWGMRRINPHAVFADDDDDYAMRRESSAYHTVTTSADSDKRRLSVSSPLLFTEAPPPAIPLRNGFITPQDKPVAIISAYQHVPRRSLDTLTHTNSDSSAGIKIIEKSGEYDDDLHSILVTGKETLL